MDLDDEIADSIALYFKDNKLSPTGEAEKIHSLGRTVIRDIIKRRTKSPSYSTLSKIASHFELSVAQLVSYPKTIDPSSQDAEILELWYQLNPDERRFLLSTGKTQVSSRPPPHGKSDGDG